MLKYTVAATAFLAVGLTACLDDPSGPECTPLTTTVVETRGDTVVTSSGLRYIETSPGASQQEARWCANAIVQYSGMLVDGSEFDAGDLPFIPGASNVIAGFQQGIVGMRLDATRRLIIPPNLGYGSQELRNQQNEVVIPANSTLIFDVQLIAVQ